MIAGTVLFVVATYFLMLAAFYNARVRLFHVPVMASIMLCDLFFPVYLVMTRDWYQRLIIEQDLLTFGVWMHLGFVIALFVMYGVQIQAGRTLLQETADVGRKKEHRLQGIGILIVRAMVILTGALLVQSVEPSMVEQEG